MDAAVRCLITNALGVCLFVLINVQVFHIYIFRRFSRGCILFAALCQGSSALDTGFYFLRAAALHLFLFSHSFFLFGGESPIQSGGGVS